MFARIVVVYNDLNYFVGSENERVGVGPVDLGVRCVRACRQDAVQRRHLGIYVSDVVEERIICAIVQVVHFQIESDRVIDSVEKLFLVVRHQTEVVEGLKSFNLFWLRLWLGLVVNKPASHIRIETIRYDIEEILSQISVHANHGCKR
jgi:hypothetical protein